MKAHPQGRGWAPVPGSHVVVRIPHEGTLFGPVVARHPGSRVTAIVAGRRQEAGRHFVDHLALVEGLPDSEVAAVLLGWKRRYGESPEVLGGPFALRLPVDLGLRQPPTVSAMLRLAGALPGAGCVLEDGAAELWSPCGTPEQAERRCAQLRQELAGLEASVEAAEPRPEDADCWSVLRVAATELLADPVA